jgi:hypothetical protein
MLRIALSLLAAIFLSGCFVLDELDQGDALIEKHSSGWREEKKLREKAEEEAAAGSSNSPSTSWEGVKEKAQKWWQNALEEEAVTADPNDIVIRCEVGGQIHFLRESDCGLRGGRATAPRSNPIQVPPSV